MTRQRVLPTPSSIHSKIDSLNSRVTEILDCKFSVHCFKASLDLSTELKLHLTDCSHCKRIFVICIPRIPTHDCFCITVKNEFRFMDFFFFFTIFGHQSSSFLFLPTPSNWCPSSVGFILHLLEFSFLFIATELVKTPTFIF